MMNKWNRSEAISTLRSIYTGQLTRYNYQLARYFNRSDLDLHNYSEYTNTISPAFSFRDRSDLFEAPNLNVIKSVIDTIVSKLSNNKALAFLNTINGTRKTRQIVKQAQIYFDYIFDELDLHSIIEQAFKQACIFDTGYILIDPFTYEITNPGTWQVSTLSSEGNKPTIALISYEHMPSFYLNKYGINSTNQYNDVNIFIDINNKQAVLFVDYKERKSVKLNIMPIIPIYYTKPIVGNKTVSIVDELDGIQTEIDWINFRKNKQLQLRVGQMTFVNSSSNLKSSDISPDDGVLYEIDMPLGSNQLPVESFNQNLIDPELDRMLEEDIRRAYDMVGISQLSAQSRKPSGLDSGAALQTMEDIESDRFETQTTQYVNCYTKLAKLMISILPEENNIIPISPNNSSFTWKDLKEQQNLFKVQFSAASALSRDPAEKTKQILQWTQIGLIGPEEVAERTNLPDTQGVWNAAAAVSNAIDTCIERAIENEVYEIPEYLNYQQLAQRIAITENELYSSFTGNKKDDIEVAESLKRVMVLDEKLTEIMEQNGFIEQTPIEGQQSDSGLAINNTNSAIQAMSGTAAAITPSKLEQSADVLNTVEQQNEV